MRKATLLGAIPLLAAVAALCLRRDESEPAPRAPPPPPRRALSLSVKPRPLTVDMLARLTGLSASQGSPAANAFPVDRTVHGLRLLGTLRSRSNQLSLASFALEGRSTSRTLGEGDEVLGYVLREVGWKHVILERDGERLRLALQEESTREPAPAPRAPEREASPLRSLRRMGGDDVSVDRNDALALQGRLDLLSREGTFVGHLDGAKLDGFRLVRSRPGGLFEQLGLQPGDVIQQVNGMRLNDFSALAGAAERLSTASLIEVRVLRGGAVLTKRLHLR